MMCCMQSCNCKPCGHALAICNIFINEAIRCSLRLDYWQFLKCLQNCNFTIPLVQWKYTTKHKYIQMGKHFLCLVVPDTKKQCHSRCLLWLRFRVLCSHLCYNREQFISILYSIPQQLVRESWAFVWFIAFGEMCAYFFLHPPLMLRSITDGDPFLVKLARLCAIIVVYISLCSHCSGNLVWICEPCQFPSNLKRS